MNKRWLLPFLVGAILFWGASSPVRAQQGTTTPPLSPPPSEPRVPITAENPEADESLHLRQDQKDRIKAIRDDSAQQIVAAQKDATLTADQKERKIKQIRKTTRAKVFAVLTIDQQKTWAEDRREQRQSKGKPAQTP